MFWSIIFCIPSRACYSTGFTVYFHVSAYPITQKTKFAHLTAQPALRHNTHSGCAKIHLFLLSIKSITRPLLNHVAQTGQGRAPTSAKFRAPVPSFPLPHPPEKKPNEAHSPRPLSSNNTPHTHLRHQLKDEQKKKLLQVQVMWRAPPAGSGCVIFTAMVLEEPNRWYAEDGHLSRTFCEMTPKETEQLDELRCCACDEARYKVSLSSYHGSRSSACLCGSRGFWER